MLPPLPATAETVKQRMDRGERIIFLDARSPDEWDRAERRLAGAVRLRPSEVENHLRLIPQGYPIITYCDCPDLVCSTRAAEALMENGWKDVHPLAGGFSAAVEQGLPTEETKPLR